MFKSHPGVTAENVRQANHFHSLSLYRGNDFKQMNSGNTYEGTSYMSGSMRAYNHAGR